MFIKKLTPRVVFFLSSLILLFAPIVRGGKTSTALMTIELLGLLILFIIFWTGMHCNSVGKQVKWLIYTSLCIIVLYLIPIPIEWWQQLPGRKLYSETISLVFNGNIPSFYHTLSLVPLHTLSVLISCIPALALFLAASSLPTKHLIGLICAFLISASLQAILGIIQHLSDDPFWYFGVWAYAPQGSYLNQNHLTAFMEMAEPLSLALMMYFIIMPVTRHRYLKWLPAILFAGISLLLTYIPLITASRTGTALLLLSIILSFWVMTTPSIRKQVMLPIIALRLLLLGLAIYLQLTLIQKVAQVVTEMQPKAVVGDLRFELWERIIDRLPDLLPWGSGPGTFAQAFKMQAPHNVDLFINHAHNDYLQLVFEWGGFGIFVITAILILYLWRWKIIFKQKEGLYRMLSSGAGIGMLIFLLFSLTDFNLHTPSNTLFMAFLFGIFLRTPIDSDP